MVRLDDIIDVGTAWEVCDAGNGSGDGSLSSEKKETP